MLATIIHLLEIMDSNWTEYNDSIVRPWDHKSRLLRDCFGGPRASENSWSWQAKNDASVLVHTC